MLKETILEKWKEAFKAKDELLKSAYSMVKAKILVEEKSGKYTLPLSDEIVVNIITKEVKELKETQQSMINAQRFSDAGDIQIKIDELEQYLPKQMSVEEVKVVINKLMGQENNKGKLIGLTVKEVGNRFDKAKIAQLVSEVLSSYGY